MKRKCPKIWDRNIQKSLKCKKMRMLDLFSGIGGFSLAAEWCWGKELEIVGFVENDKHCQRVLKKQFPNTPIHSDIRDFKCDTLNNIDLITGGFPCQDISIAGKGVGIEGERSGFWTEFKRIISEVRPGFALIENVPILTHRGLDRVLCDLAEIGYDAEWQSISASEVGAWHKRERIWIVAYPNKIGSDTRYTESYRQGNEEGLQGRSRPQYFPESLDKIIPDTTELGCKQGTSQRRTVSEKIGRAAFDKRNTSSREKLPNTSDERLEGKITTGEFSRGQQGLPPECDWWAAEPELGRVAHGIPDRVDRLKSLGNAIVPQNAFIIMQQIKRLID